MRKVLLTLVLAGSLAVAACGGDKPAPPPPPVLEACHATGVGSGDKTTWSGDCVQTVTCKGPDSKGFFYGSSCQAR